MIRALALIALAGAWSGFIARPAVDDTALYLSETCDRAPLPDATGRYRARNLACRATDWWVYGDTYFPHSRATACWLADLRPTDANIEACTGEPI